MYSDDVESNYYDILSVSHGSFMCESNGFLINVIEFESQ